MFQYRQFYGDLLCESYRHRNFSGLPAERPYGFMVYPDGEFNIVNGMYGHETAAGGPEEMYKIMNKGGSRVVVNRDDDKAYQADISKTPSSKAKKTIQDLADHYQMKADFKIAWWLP